MRAASRASRSSASRHRSATLERLRDEPRLALGGDRGRHPARFRVRLQSPMGTGRRSTRKQGFIDSVLDAVVGFYAGVLQDITPFTPKGSAHRAPLPRPDRREPVGELITQHRTFERTGELGPFDKPVQRRGHETRTHRRAVEPNRSAAPIPRRPTGNTPHPATRLPTRPATSSKTPSPTSSRSATSPPATANSPPPTSHSSPSPPSSPTQETRDEAPHPTSSGPAPLRAPVMWTVAVIGQFWLLRLRSGVAVQTQAARAAHIRDPAQWGDRFSGLPSAGRGVGKARTRYPEQREPP